MTRFYIRHNGKLLGPADPAKIAERLADGRFGQDALFSLDQITWAPATAYPALLAAIPPPPISRPAAPASPQVPPLSDALDAPAPPPLRPSFPQAPFAPRLPQEDLPPRVSSKGVSLQALVIDIGLILALLLAVGGFFSVRNRNRDALKNLQNQIAPQEQVQTEE